MDLQLIGKTALVTGSSKGIGEAIARYLAAEGATVVVHGRDRAQTNQVAGSIIDNGGRAHCVTGDLTVDDEVRLLVEEAARVTGGIDILINNAGGSGTVKEDWSNARPDTWAASYDRNVLAALRVILGVLPGMKATKWGRIINISSLAATAPPPAGADYSAAKAGMNAMTASLAKAVAGDGVTVNAISPGTVHSARLDQRFREVAAEKGLADIDAPWDEVEGAVLPMFAQVPLGRVGRLEEISAAVAFLASPLAAYITGVNLRVDGGMSQSL
jgi:3-oxoacyl-[acyl-carrier protein] reductase